jgi:hypothetical protein
MYHHKWEMKMGKMEAIISVPKNIESVLEDPTVPVSEESLSGTVFGNTMMKRANAFRQRLLNIVYKSYKEFRASKNQSADDVFTTKQWPVDFDYDDEEIVPEVPLAQLKEQPVIQHKSTSIDNFINSIDKRQIVQDVMKKAFEEDQQMRQEQPEESCSSSARDSSEEAARKNRQSGITSATLNAV